MTEQTLTALAVGTEPGAAAEAAEIAEMAGIAGIVDTTGPEAAAEAIGAAGTEMPGITEMPRAAVSTNGDGTLPPELLAAMEDDDSFPLEALSTEAFTAGFDSPSPGRQAAIPIDGADPDQDDDSTLGEAPGIAENEGTGAYAGAPGNGEGTLKGGDEADAPEPSGNAGNAANEANAENAQNAGNTGKTREADAPEHPAAAGAAEAPKQPDGPAAPGERIPAAQFVQDMHTLMAKHEDLRGTAMPQELIDAYFDTGNPETAYQSYRTGCMFQRLEAMEQRLGIVEQNGAAATKQLEILQQNEAAAKRSHISGRLSTGGASAPSWTDSLFRGFDEERQFY